MTDSECRCLAGWTHYLDFQERVVGDDPHRGPFAEVSILICRRCGQHWLRYLYEQPAFTRSGRWWRGPVSPAVAAAITPETALATLEALAFYYVGGSYYGGHIRRSQGPITDL